MVGKVLIQNFKSIVDLEMELGRANVLIGANGSGKSNILEAIAINGAAASEKLDNEFLVSRGIRVSTNPEFMIPAFKNPEQVEYAINGKRMLDRIRVRLDSRYSSQSNQINYDAHILPNFGNPYNPWVNSFQTPTQLGHRSRTTHSEEVKELFDTINDRKESASSLNLIDFLIFSPELAALRTFEQEGQIQPLGIKGEGLFKLLRYIASMPDKTQFEAIKQELQIMDWFEDLSIPGDLLSEERTMRFRDRYLKADLNELDQRSTNEGFLFLLFYFTLMISDLTPKFFAIDNIDASLNPKLCSELMKRIAALAKVHDKQVILTTHNPAILDGLDLNDDEQRLLTIYRNRDGHTVAKRVPPLKPVEGVPAVRLSEAFARGYIGGLPNNF